MKRCSADVMNGMSKQEVISKGLEESNEALKRKLEVAEKVVELAVQKLEMKSVGEKVV